MIKINQIARFFYLDSSGVILKNIKKIGIQANHYLGYLYINNQKYEIGRTNMIQFDDLSEESLEIKFKTGENKSGNTSDPIFVIIDYEERID